MSHFHSPTKHDFIASKYKHLAFLPRISNKDNFNSIEDMSRVSEWMSQIGVLTADWHEMDSDTNELFLLRFDVFVVCYCVYLLPSCTLTCSNFTPVSAQVTWKRAWDCWLWGRTPTTCTGWVWLRVVSYTTFHWVGVGNNAVISHTHF